MGLRKTMCDCRAMEVSQMASFVFQNLTQLSYIQRITLQYNIITKVNTWVRSTTESRYVGVTSEQTWWVTLLSDQISCMYGPHLLTRFGHFLKLNGILKKNTSNRGDFE